MGLIQLFGSVASMIPEMALTLIFPVLVLAETCGSPTMIMWRHFQAAPYITSLCTKSDMLSD